MTRAYGTRHVIGEGPHVRLWNLDGEGLRHIWGESKPGTQDISALAATARFIAAAKQRESAADTLSASSAASSSESEGEAAAAAQRAAGRSRVNREELPNEEELLSALPEAERLAYKIQIKECVERQRQAIRLLHRCPHISRTTHATRRRHDNTVSADNNAGVAVVFC